LTKRLPINNGENKDAIQCLDCNAVYSVTQVSKRPYKKFITSFSQVSLLFLPSPTLHFFHPFSFHPLPFHTLLSAPFPSFPLPYPRTLKSSYRFWEVLRTPQVGSGVKLRLKSNLVHFSLKM